MFQNGTPYTITYKQDGVYLVIKPSNAIDRSLILGQVIKALSEKGITNINRQALMQTINNANGVKTKIADKSTGRELDAELKITISPDKMSASLLIIPPDGGKDLTVEQIMDAIRAKGIIWGIDNVLIATLGIQPIYNENIEFAKGTEAKKGEDGKLDILFDINTEKKPKLMEDGSVDFRELNYIISVKAGDTLARIIPPQDGVAGKNILGQILLAPKGKPVRNPKGKNVELTDNDRNVVAKLDGHASFVGDKINVLNVLDIPGNVDVSTGNIRFSGNVIIRGNVISNSIIEASGSVEVYGIVEGAVIKADGDIILKRGIQGLNKGKLISGQDVIARFIEHCTISAKKNIRTESIMHCNINCGETIELIGPKGLMVGGNIKVRKLIDAKIIGSPMSTPTFIELGIEPEKRNRYKVAKGRFDELTKKLNEMELSISTLSAMNKKNTITPQKKMLLVSLVKSKQPLNDEFDALKEELETLEEELDSVNLGKIKVRNKIYPGVKITIGSISKFIKEIEEFVVISLDGADIKLTPYQ